MPTANDTAITIRTNREVKDRAQALFGDLGLDLSTAINLFLRQSVREERIPFLISRDEPSVATYKAIEDSFNEQNLEGPFSSWSETLESLNA